MQKGSRMGKQIDNKAIALVEKSLPANAAEELVDGVVAETKRALGRAAPRIVIDRVLVDYRAAVSAQVQIPASLLPRLVQLAQRHAPASELDALVESALAPQVARIEKRIPAFVAQARGEGALHAQAMRMHRAVLRDWRYAHERAGAIINDDVCSLGTAILVYWLCKPHWYRQYRRRAEVAAYEHETWDALREIKGRVARDDFPHASIAFDPRKGPGNIDWTRDEYCSRPRVTEIPVHMRILTTAMGVEPLRARRTASR